MKASVDVADLIGLNLVMSRNAGKGEYKIMVAALGWATAELIMSRCVEKLGGQTSGRGQLSPTGVLKGVDQRLGAGVGGVWVLETVSLCFPQLHPSLGGSPRH